MDENILYVVVYKRNNLIKWNIQNVFNNLSSAKKCLAFLKKRIYNEYYSSLNEQKWLDVYNSYIFKIVSVNIDGTNIIVEEGVSYYGKDR